MKLYLGVSCYDGSLEILSFLYMTALGLILVEASLRFDVDVLISSLVGKFFGKTMPASGGFYLRFLPLKTSFSGISNYEKQICLCFP